MYALKDSEEVELMRELNMQKPATGRCAFCPEWVIDGTAEEVTAATKAHRMDVHQITPKKAKRGTGRPCSNGSCENPAVISRGRFAGWCSACRDGVLNEEKATAKRERQEHAARQRALKAARPRKRPTPKPKVASKKKVSPPRPRPSVAKMPASSAPHPMHLMTEERAETVLSLYRTGHSAVSIGRDYWEPWGYRNDKSLTQMVYALLKKHGISRRSRSEAVRLTLEREGPRASTYVQPSLLTEERLKLVEELVAEGCSVRAIAMIAWDIWGFASTESCREAIVRHGRRHGRKVGLARMREIPLVSRETARERIEKV